MCCLTSEQNNGLTKMAQVVIIFKKEEFTTNKIKFPLQEKIIIETSI